MLERFLQTAVELDLPVLLHAVHDRAETVFRMLQTYRVRKAVFHWLKAPAPVVNAIVGRVIMYRSLLRCATGNGIGSWCCASRTLPCCWRPMPPGATAAPSVDIPPSRPGCDVRRRPCPKSKRFPSRNWPDRPRPTLPGCLDGTVEAGVSAKNLRRNVKPNPDGPRTHEGRKLAIYKIPWYGQRGIFVVTGDH